MFMAAAWADKLGGSVWDVRDPVGVIGITAPAQWPMLGLCSLLAPAIAAGTILCTAGVTSTKLLYFL